MLFVSSLKWSAPLARCHRPNFLSWFKLFWQNTFIDLIKISPFLKDRAGLLNWKYCASLIFTSICQGTAVVYLSVWANQTSWIKILYQFSIGRITCHHQFQFFSFIRLVNISWLDNVSAKKRFQKLSCLFANTAVGAITSTLVPLLQLIEFTSIVRFLVVSGTDFSHFELSRNWRS